MKRRPNLTFAVPALVAGLMIVVGVVVSERVLARLVETQERHVSELSGAYLDGLSSSIVPHVLREDIWEVFDTLARTAALYEALQPVDTVVTGPEGRVIAANDPIAVPSFEPIPTAISGPLGDADFRIDDDKGRAYMHRRLVHQGQHIGSIYAIADIQHLLDERAEVMLTLIATNAFLTLLLAGAGYLVVRRMVRPVRVLADHLREGVSGRARPIAASRLPAPGTEARRLFDAYNSLVRAEQEREDLTLRLAEEERLASLGKLASGMAHEINNPLGGLFNALDTLKRHGDTMQVRETSISLLERGLQGIRNVVDATLQTYRPDTQERPFGPSDLDDLKYLIQPALKRKGLSCDWDNRLTCSIAVPNAPLRQAVLNLLLNACAAAPDKGRVAVAGWYDCDAIRITVADDGPGLPEQAVDALCAYEPMPPVGGHNGLGLWMVRRLVAELDGMIVLGRGPLGGASIEVIVAGRPCDKSEDKAIHVVA